MQGTDRAADGAYTPMPSAPLARKISRDNGVPTPRELACRITDREGEFLSESSVYRILKVADLIESPAYILPRQPTASRTRPGGATNSGRRLHLPAGGGLGLVLPLDGSR